MLRNPEDSIDSRIEKKDHMQVWGKRVSIGRGLALGNSRGRFIIPSRIPHSGHKTLNIEVGVRDKI